MVDLLPTNMGSTWRNGRDGDVGVSKRLDRFLAFETFLFDRDHFQVWTQPFEILDHFPICLE